MKKLAVLFCLLVFAAKNISANEQTPLKQKKQHLNSDNSSTHYSIGVGLSMMTIDDYIGADESQFYLLPTPYLYYQSDSVVIDRNAFEGNLFNSKKWHLAVDAAGSIPVDSSKNKTRQGMDDLDWVGELGPSLEYYFDGDSRALNRTYIDFSVRKAISTDFKKISDTGWSGQISLNNKKQLSTEVLGGKTVIDSTVAILFYSDRYAQYFYSVAPQYANEERSQYSASGGYAGARLSLGGTWRRDNIWLGVFTRYTQLNNAAFEQSPLVKSNSNLLVGLSISYIFMEK